MESPSEKEERLQRQEERLQKAHERIKEQREMPAKEPSRGGGGFGNALGGVAGFFGEHKIILFAVGITVVAIAVLYANRKSLSSGSTSAPNQSPDWSQSGVAPSGIQMAFDQLTQQLNNIQSQLAGQQTPTPSPPPPISNPPHPTNNPPIPPDVKNGFVNKPLPSGEFVTAQQWPSPMGSLSGIAATEHISLSRIEALNPQLYNQRPGSGWNLIYAGQRVRIA